MMYKHEQERSARDCDDCGGMASCSDCGEVNEMAQKDPIVLKKRETDVEDYLRRQCLARGWDCDKIDPANRRGMQDRLVLPGNGLVYFIELKREKGPIKPLQARRLVKMIERGYNAYIIEGKPEVEMIIKRIETALNGL